MILGFAALASVAIHTPFRALGIGLGLPLLFIGIGILGKYGQYARSLQWLVKKEVRIEIWNMTMVGSNGAEFKIEAITLLGAGLWIYLSSKAGDTPKKLKIAQPTALTQGATYAEISFARYAQWAGKRLKNPNGMGYPGKVLLYLA